MYIESVNPVILFNLLGDNCSCMPMTGNFALSNDTSVGVLTSLGQKQSDRTMPFASNQFAVYRLQDLRFRPIHLYTEKQDKHKSMANVFVSQKFVTEIQLSQLTPLKQKYHRKLNLQFC